MDNYVEMQPRRSGRSRLGVLSSHLNLRVTRFETSDKMTGRPLSRKVRQRYLPLSPAPSAGEAVAVISMSAGEST